MTPVMPCRNNFEQQRASVDLNVMFAIILLCYKDVCAAVEYFMFTFLFIFTPHIFVEGISGFFAYLNG